MNPKIVISLMIHGPLVVNSNPVYSILIFNLMFSIWLRMYVCLKWKTLGTAGSFTNWNNSDFPYRMIWKQFLISLVTFTVSRSCLPKLKKQEIVGKIGGINYWEGACDVLNESGESIGQAYVELAGYDGQLSDRLK